MRTIKTLRDLYNFSGFRARSTLKPHPEDKAGYIITLERRQKKQFVPVAAKHYQAIVTDERMLYETWMPEPPVSTLHSSIAGLPARIVTP